jgi:hypothetical protein
VTEHAVATNRRLVTADVRDRLRQLTEAHDGTGIATDRPRIDAQGVTGVSGSTRDRETVGDE